jgi:FkbM family methyltransferase
MQVLPAEIRISRAGRKLLDQHGEKQKERGAMRKMKTKDSMHIAVSEPPTPEAPAADRLAECRRDLDAVAAVAGQLIANANGQGEINRRLTERLLAVEQRLHSAEGAHRHFAVYLGDHVALTWALDRYKMYVDTRDKAISVHLLTEGGWEPDITRLLYTLVEPGMRVVDVGANMGYFSLLLSDRVGANGFLWAFEPEPRNFQLLEWNLDVNGFTPRSKVHRMAAFDRRAQVRLWQNPVNLGGHSVLPADSPDIAGEILTVDAAPLDECIDAPIDVMKIDAEGSEPFIWDGMRRIIERSPRLRILLEFDPAQIRGKGRDPRAFLERIHEDRFEIKRIRFNATLAPATDDELVNGKLVMLHLSRP